ncbi:MAG UNVERIFIED_CONTAM: serine/threonine dehydratase [Rickettsiaceae bacterium]|jgi:threonine dehydratase
MIQIPENVKLAYDRIKNHLHNTPILRSEILNQMLGANIFFKVESLQKTGAFKVRGVLNHLLILREEGRLPSKVVGYSTGNHGIGLAWAAQRLGIHARIYLPKNTSPVKQRAASYYGAEVIYTDSRLEAEERTKYDGNNGFYYMHPSDSDYTIAGAGTLCYEALLDMNDQKPDVIFASCGGGGLLSGSYLAKELLSPTSKIIGTEPLNANDAYLSLKQNSIFRFDTSPDTIADGLRTLGISERTFGYLKKLDDFYLVEESRILYWTAWLIHLLKVACEPSCAMNMEAVAQWISKSGNTNSTILVLISGGNIDPILYRQLWEKDYLAESPVIDN